MLNQLKMYFLDLKGRLKYIQEKGEMIGHRNMNGRESVIYLLGSRFYEILESEKGTGKIRRFRSLKELQHTMSQEIIQH